ncbi:MAG: NACHT domain-containing protein, partial [Cyanothece sp. SIO1E1]|nr:NACHT domain-containing protein [Cyanothece sp. SIO1E1]
MAVLEYLAAVGVREFGSYVFQDIFMPLVQGSLEDYTKDVFKSCIADFAGLTQQAPIEQAAVQSLKIFLELFENELLEWDVTGAEIRDVYQIPLKQFVHSRDVKPILGEVFKLDQKRIKADALATLWQVQALPVLPEDFDWRRICKQYLKRVQNGLMIEIPELRTIIELQHQQVIRTSVERIAGIAVDFDLEKYQEALRERFGRLQLESIDTTGVAYNALRLWNIFVPQSVRECQEFTPQLYELPKEQLSKLYDQGDIEALLEANAIEHHRKTYLERPIEPVLSVVSGDVAVPHTVILGDPGAGKSTLLQYMALNWAEKPLAELKGQPIPILIELRTYARDRQAGKCHNFLSYLHQGNTACRLNQTDLHELFKSGNATALFDGVDEVLDPALREEVVNDIHRFSNNYPNVQIIATSRWLGYKAETLRNAGFRHFMLQDLDDDQIGDFIQRWHDLTFTEAEAADKVRKRDRLQKAIDESKPIRELAGNPLLLTMMAILNRNQELPRDRARLYEKASEVLLYQWDVERKILEDERLKDWSIDARDKQAMLRKVAYHMQSKEEGLAGNVINRDDLEHILTEYLKSIDVDQARSVARLMIEQLRTRNFILCHLGADTYAFVHRTFLEYFCAAEFVWQFEKERKIDIEYLKDELYGKHYQDESWNEVLRLIAGMIESHFVGEIITSLLEHPIQIWQFSLSALYARSNLALFAVYLKTDGIRSLLLASLCMAELRNRNDIKMADNQLRERLFREAERQHPYFLDEVAANAVTDAIGSIYPASYSRLKALLNLDEFSYSPQASIRALAKHWKEDPDTLPMLKERAQSDDSGAVRRAAVQELARGWKEDPDTLP